MHKFQSETHHETMMNIKIKHKDLAVLAAITLLLLLSVLFLKNSNEMESYRMGIVSGRYVLRNSKKDHDNHTDLVQQFYALRKNLTLSTLGASLFLDKPFPKPKQKRFKILIWKDGPFLERRHIKAFSNVKSDPFSHCLVKNCEITYDDAALNTSHAVIFLLHRLKNFKSLPDPYEKRPEGQRWVFLTDESPKHTFLFSNFNWNKQFQGIFNWSMSYKMESDIPMPYGRTIPLLEPVPRDTDISNLVPYAELKSQSALVAILISNCSGKRMAYLKELSKHIDVHIYGNCGTKFKNTCPGHFQSDCKELKRYIFYLTFENSHCDQYITEKVYWNAYKNGAIPIIMGPSRNSCKLHLPPNSYLHIDDYAKPLDLARHLQYLNHTWNTDFANIAKMHEWRRHFEIINEHGYFGSKSVHYCRICEALNFNNENTKVYDDLSFFLSSTKNCN